jgi:hypothetical protein
MLAEASSRPQIKALGSPSVVCQHQSCEEPALFLFRSNNGPITGYCEVHAGKLAALFGIELPEPPLNRIRTGWKVAAAAATSGR